MADDAGRGHRHYRVNLSPIRFSVGRKHRFSSKTHSCDFAPVQVLGAMDLPAVPMNTGLEKAMLPNPEKVGEMLESLLSY